MKILFALVIPGIVLTMPAHADENINDRLSIQATSYLLAANTDTDGTDTSNMDTEMDTSNMDTGNMDTEMDTSNMDTGNIDTEMDTSNMDTEMDTSNIDTSNID